MKSKNTCLLFLLLFTGICASYGQTIEFTWANGVNGLKNDAGYGIATDKAGYIYVTGHSQDSAKMDIGPSLPPVNIKTKGGSDMLLAKYAPSGHLIWAHVIGGSGADAGNSVTVDKSGNIYVAGEFNGKVDFDPGPDLRELESTGGVDAFIAKYDSSGKYLWAKKIGSTSSDYGQAVAVNHKNEVVVVGRYSAAVRFSPTVELTTNGGADVFVAKYSADGSELWATGFGGSGTDQGEAVAVDPSANIFVTGRFNSTVNFGTGQSAASVVSKGSSDIYLAKFSDQGSFLWVRQFGSKVVDYAQAISTDVLGNVYFAGNFNDTIDINTRSGVKRIPNVAKGYSDFIMAKHDPDGNHIWSFSVGGNKYDNILGMAMNAKNELYLTGQFSSDSVNFNSDLTRAVYHKPLRPGYDMFIAKYDSSGKYIWSKTAGGTSSDLSNAIATGIDDDIYTTGYYYTDIRFETMKDSIKLMAAGNNDMMVVKTKEYCESFKQVRETACGSFLFKNRRYYASGTYVDTFKNRIGCDSIVTLDLIVSDTTAAVFTGTYCDSVSFNGVSYYTSGTYLQAYKNRYGCDSNFSYELTINRTDTATEVSATACGIYRINDTLSYTRSGIYLVRLLNRGGCDSSVILDLQIEEPETATISREGNLLKSGNRNPGTSYQWISCDNNQTIPGATGQSFEPEESGNYAVIITSGACSDTSDCVRAEGKANLIGTESRRDHIDIYPNPTESLIYIRAANPQALVRIRLTGTNGQLLLSREITGHQPQAVDLTGFAAGMYFLETESEDGSLTRRKITKQ